MASGIHTSENVSNAINCLKSEGKTFIGRYYAVRNTWKVITSSEAQAISSAGLYIVSIWEDGPADSPSYFTRSQGHSDGYSGFNKAMDMGQTSGTPVYFAVDFDATLNEKQAILDYFRGVEDGYLSYIADRQKYGETPI